jgi:hypothetical protein
MNVDSLERLRAGNIISLDGLLQLYNRETEPWRKIMSSEQKASSKGSQYKETTNSKRKANNIFPIGRHEINNHLERLTKKRNNKEETKVKQYFPARRQKIPTVPKNDESLHFSQGHLYHHQITRRKQLEQS